MTRPMAASHRELPRSDTVPHPRRLALHTLRPAARAVVRCYVRVHAHRTDRVPRTGPVILAPTHTGWADGPLLAIFATRPAHVMTKREMFAGRMGGFLRMSGQIELDRFHPDPRAVKTCLRVLRDGGAVGIFPEGTRGAGDLSRFNHGAAYLALVTGVPVVPVVMFGTRAPGARSSSLPPRFGVVDLVYGRPWHVDAEPWPRTHRRLVEASASLRAHMLECLAEGERLTGRSMPGPLPAGDKEYAVPGQTSEWESHD
ncbi:MAG: lysophospholipid acyltransferase family protein [Nocardioidaceae bacterium]